MKALPDKREKRGGEERKNMGLTDDGWKMKIKKRGVRQRRGKYEEGDRNGRRNRNEKKLWRCKQEGGGRRE